MNLTLLRRSIRLSARIGYSRSGGPGGQNVNKVSTKVTLHLALTDIEGLSETELNHLKETLDSRLTEQGEIIVTSSEERSRRTNQERAFTRLTALVTAAARLPKQRRPTAPTAASREKRLQAKRAHGLIKKSRRFPPEE